MLRFALILSAPLLALPGISFGRHLVIHKAHGGKSVAGRKLVQAKAQEPDDPEKWRNLIQESAERNAVPAELVESVLMTESNGRENVKSRVGARGLMQLMPATAREFGAKSFGAAASIEAGARYLAHLIERYKHRADGLRCALAAYNAGPTRVARYGGVPPFPETRAYVEKVLNRLKLIHGELAEQIVAEQVGITG